MSEVLGHEDFELLWDTGATLTVTPFETDFITPVKSTDKPLVMQGLAKGLAVKGMGEVEWSVCTVDGRYEKVRSPAYFVPEAKPRIFSPPTYFQTYGKGSYADQDGDGINLRFLNSKVLKISYNSSNNLQHLKDMVQH
jgi:hypothetical protein